MAPELYVQGGGAADFGLALLGGLFGIPAIEGTKAAKSILGRDADKPSGVRSQG
jgi:hypothetical protein